MANENAARDAAISGGVSGALLGAGSALVDNATKKSLIRRALIGMLGGGALAGSSIGLGHKMLGEPDDEGSYTRSGAVGGASLGGLLGGAGGYLLSKKFLRFPQAEGGLLGKFSSLPPGQATKLGALGGAVVGGYQGADEGMQLDFIANEVYRREQEDLQKERLRRVMSGEF